MLRQLYDLVDRGEWVQVKREAERLMLLPDLDYFALGRIYRAGGRACVHLGELHACVKVVELGLPYAFRSGDWDSLGVMRHDAGVAHLFLAEIDQAQELFIAYLMDIARYREARRLEGFVHYNLGLLYRQRKEYSLAVAAYKQALHCFVERGLTRDTADCQQNIAWLYLVQNKPDEARIHIDLAAGYQQHLPEDYGTQQLNLWALYHVVRQEPLVALEYVRPILQGLLPSSDQRRASAFWIACKAHAQQEDWTRAKDMWQKAHEHAFTAKAAHLLNLCADVKEELKARLGEAAQ